MEVFNPTEPSYIVCVFVRSLHRGKSTLRLCCSEILLLAVVQTHSHLFGLFPSVTGHSLKQRVEAKQSGWAKVFLAVLYERLLGNERLELPPF